MHEDQHAAKSAIAAAGATIVEIGAQGGEALAQDLLRALDIAVDEKEAARLAEALGETGPVDLTITGEDARLAWKVAGSLTSDGDAFRLNGLALRADREARRHANYELRLREMAHRHGNLFAILGGMISLQATDAESVGQFAEKLRSRLMALYRAHRASLGDMAAHETRDMKTLLQIIAAPFGGAEGRIVLEGEALPLTDRAREAFGVAAHEWLTNAIKHGALRTPKGRIMVSWSVEQDEFRLIWREETGGEIVAPPAKTGGGEGVTSFALARIGAKASREWRPGGLVIRVDASARATLG